MAPSDQKDAANHRLVSIIIVSYNTAALLDACLKSVRKCGTQSFEVIVIDNNSTDGSGTMVRERYPEVKFVASKTNLGYSAAINLGVSISSGHYLLLLNSDAELSCGAVDSLISVFVTKPKVGVCGPKLLNPDGSLQQSIAPYPNSYDLLATFLGAFLNKRKPKQSVPSHPNITSRVSGWLTGACILTTREVWQRVGKLDEKFFFMLEDVDWNLRLNKAGYETWYSPETTVLHRLGASRRNHCEELDVLLKKSNVSQKLYYARKHFPKCQVFQVRAALIVMLSANLLSRTIGDVLAHRQHRIQSRHQRRVAMEMLKASIA